MKNYAFDPRTDLETYSEDMEDRTNYIKNYVKQLILSGGRIEQKSTALDAELSYVQDIIRRLRESQKHVQTSLMSPGTYPELSSDFLAGMLRGLNLCIAMFEGDKIEIKNLQVLRDMEKKIKQEIEDDSSSKNSD